MWEQVTINAVEMSTIRIQHGEPHVSIFVSGPKGGHRGLLRFDVAEADSLAKALADAVRDLEEDKP